jgi:hypothetical protein
MNNELLMQIFQPSGYLSYLHIDLSDGGRCRRQKRKNHIQLGFVILISDILDDCPITMKRRNLGWHMAKIESETIEFRNVRMLQTLPDLGRAAQTLYEKMSEY